VFLESIGLPLPGEAILVSAAIFAGTTQELGIALGVLGQVQNHFGPSQRPHRCPATHTCPIQYWASMDSKGIYGRCQFATPAASATSPAFWRSAPLRIKVASTWRRKGRVTVGAR
jgi:hypothetical protein